MTDNLTKIREGLERFSKRIGFALYGEQDSDRKIVDEALKALNSLSAPDAKEGQGERDTVLALKSLIDAHKRLSAGFGLPYEEDIATVEYAERVLEDLQQPAAPVPDLTTEECEEMMEAVINAPHAAPAPEPEGEALEAVCRELVSLMQTPTMLAGASTAERNLLDKMRMALSRLSPPSPKVEA